MEFSFIDLYRKFCAGFTDASDVYLRYAAVSLVGTCVGSRAKFKTGDQDTYANCWIVLLGSSSSCRKSTTISIAQRLLEEAEPKEVMPTSLTTEALFARLQTHPTGCMFHSEFLSFLEGLKKEYNSALKSTLTDFYDVPSLRIRKTMRETYKIERPCISMFGGTTTEWFLDQATDADFAGGFLPRFLLVPAGFKNRHIALPPPADPVKRAWLCKWLKCCFELDEMTYVMEDESRYEKWYEELEKELKTSAQSYTSYAHRLATYAIKLSMIYHISSYRLDKGEKPPTIIPDSTVRAALAETTWLFEMGERIFAEEIGTSPWLRKRKAVLRVIRRATLSEGVYEGDMLAITKMRPKEQKEVIDALCMEGRIKEREDSPGSFVITYRGSIHGRAGNPSVNGRDYEPKKSEEVHPPGM